MRFVVLGAALLTALGACSDDAPQQPTADAGEPDGRTGGDAATDDAGAVDAGDDAGGPPAFCETGGFPARPFAADGSGSHRGELAADFSVDLVDGSTWTLSEAWTGCETYVFLPDTVPVSVLNRASVWEDDFDLDDLLAASPDDVHYFFVSARSRDEAGPSIDAMATRLEAELASLGAERAAHWRAHLHVVRDRVTAIGNWIDDLLLDGIGSQGFGIDRLQRLRAVGSLADVRRFSRALNDAGQWPFEANVAYLAHEARAWDAEAARQARLDAERAAVVTFWEGEVLSQFEEIDVELPSAEEMAGFDTLEIDVTSECPDPGALEIGNCGAWDYIASLSLVDGDVLTELGRFITSYHRETHWVVDATPMLVLLQDGGTHRFRWEFAPEWNPQPTKTTLSLRLSNQGRGLRPASASFLFAGGSFDASYDDDRTPVVVDIPDDAARVELWAVVTGHGADTGNCAEFCDHQHEFTVDGAVHVLDHPAVGDDEGCIASIDEGGTPNQWGTWWYGRGGWCPGFQVDPWVVDVTADVTPGRPATIDYRGLFDGAPPAVARGNIVMTSYLVVFR